ncbi:anion transporter [Megamonas sp.]
MVLKPFVQEIAAGIVLIMLLAAFSTGQFSDLHDAQEIVAGIILLVTLIVFTLGKSPIFRVDRAGMAIVGASLMTGFGIMTIGEAVEAIDAETIVVLFSLMVVVGNLKLAGFFMYLGRLVFTHIHSCRTLLLAVIFLAGILSSVVINDIVCLLFTPVVIMICLKVKVNPVPYLLGVAMASNIGSACTFIGNPQNVLIGSLSGIPALDYFAIAAPLSLIGLILLYLFIRYTYRQDMEKTFTIETNETSSLVIHKYLITKTLLVLAFVIIFYLLGLNLTLTASFGAAFLLINTRIKPERIYENIDFNLLIIFIGLFVIIAGVEKSGLLSLIYNFLPPQYMEEIPLFGIMAIVLSNIVSNVPAVLLLRYYIPADEQVLWQALALLSTIAGNLTVFGSIANLIVLEIAKKQGIKITSKQYLKIGFPLTVLLSAISIVWFEWMR